MTTERQMIDALSRDLRRLRVGFVALVAIGAGVMLTAATASDSDAKFRTLTVERLNVVERDGTFRAVLSNGERMPGPMMRGRIGAREGKRNQAMGGLILYDRSGEEQGGYATGDPTPAGTIAVSTLDWKHGRGEAVATFRKVDDRDAGDAGIWITDYPPPGATPADGVDRRRIKLQNVDRDAELLLADASGRDRIRLRVDRAGDASIEIVDRAGRTVFRAPERR